MLSLRRALPLVIAASIAGGAWAQDDEDEGGIRQPERLTVGTANNFLGQVRPDGELLYFVSNRNTTTEIYSQDQEGGRPKLLFDEGAEVTWPRVSPDGKRLLYVSFRDDAAGQLCVRELPAGRRRCLADGASAVQAQWMGPRRIVLVSRGSIEGDLRLSQVEVGYRLKARPLVERNATGPTISPDGRWLVYVPVERYVERVGPGFAARAARRLEVVRLDRPGEAPRPVVLDLPGFTGQPVFSVDGRWLYFVQFLDDSNKDGIIDAADHGVAFRVPFEGERDDAPARAAQAYPEQLTDGSWNCQYPSPGREHLILTCSKADKLDVYSLPLDGMVPRQWDRDRLQMEVDLSSRRIEQLLLYRHLLARETDPIRRRRRMMRLFLLHLELEQFDAADFYAERVRATRDPRTVGTSAILKAMVAHRRALKGREAGRTGVEFFDEERARLQALEPMPPTATAAALRGIVRSEIADAIGDKELARRELEGVTLDGVVMPGVLQAYYDQADALYRELDDPAALQAAVRRLVDQVALAPDDRLRYARAVVRAIVRGRPYAEAEALLRREQAQVAPDSELGFAIELGLQVLRIRDARPPDDVRDRLVALYQRQRRADRQRAVMLDAVSRASEVDADRVIEALARLYVDDAAKGTLEAGRARTLYRRMLQGRAYRRMAQGRFAEAREDFAEVARKTGSFEGYLNDIELRLAAGATPAQLEAEYAQQAAGSSPAVARFVRAYLLAKKLPDLSGEAHAQTVERIIAELRASWPELKRRRAVRALYGATLHEQFLTTGELSSAQRADRHYLILLDLVNLNPRYKAMVLEQLGQLHTQVGNYRIALGFLDEREKLPLTDDASTLAHRLAKARTLLHLDREADAAHQADQALALCEQKPALAEYRVLALDRAALANLAAGRFDRALALYDLALPLVDAGGAASEEAARNRLVVRLGRAAAALGTAQPRRALEDLVLVDRGLADPVAAAALRWPHTPHDEVLRAYRLIAAGLRAKAHRAVGELTEAARALEARRVLVKERLDRTHVDDHLRALALVESQLAEVAHERGDVQAAVQWTRRALAHSDDFAARARVAIDNEQLDLMWFAAELRLATGVRLRFNLPRRLDALHQVMASERDPAWRSYQRLFEIYLGVFRPAGSRRATADPHEWDDLPLEKESRRSLERAISAWLAPGRLTLAAR